MTTVQERCRRRTTPRRKRSQAGPFTSYISPATLLDECRRRIQQELHHRRGRATDFYKARRMLAHQILPTTARQQHQILTCFPATSTSHQVALESVVRTLSTLCSLIQRAWGKLLMHEKSRAHLHKRALPPHRAYHAR